MKNKLSVKEHKNLLIRRYITVTLVVTVMVTFIFGRGRISFTQIWINFIYSAVFAAANFLYFIYINKWIGWKRNPKKTLFISLAGVAPLNFLVFYCLNFLFSFFLFDQKLEDSLQITNYYTYVFVVMFSLAISLFILMLVFFKMISDEKLKNQKLKTETEKSRFNSLKSQLNPHFLFNNLNVLSALIHENPDKAEKFTLQLADIYRYLLQTEKQDLVPLEQEMDFAKKYLNLLKLRFENQVHYSLPEEYPLNKKIPPLSLQLLLENIIKHNRFSEKFPLTFELEITEDYLNVKNLLRKRKATASSTQKGLHNLIKRYELLTKRRLIIQEDAETFSVKIPLL